MSKLAIIIAVVIAAFAVVVGTSYYSTYSDLVQEKVLIETSKANLEGVFDNTFKKIAQSTQVVKFDRNSLKDIITSHAEARTGSGGGGGLMKWVQESIPNVNSDITNRLISIINGARDEYQFQQVSHNDHIRKYNQILASPFLGWAMRTIHGFTPIDAVSVTSTRTKEAFKTGVDNDVDLKLE